MRARAAGRPRRGAPVVASDDDPLWYKAAVIYELRVGAFQDSDGDGIGDFPGLTQRLDYLRELGVTALWLLPFYPSPLRDDGYDIADYERVHPDLGTLDDFRIFLREAPRRGLRVITELVINHTSDQHAWFQGARRAAPGSAAREFYVWSDTPERYADARVMFKDFEPSNWTWDPMAKAYYWHRFYAHQPDLNFDNPAVRRAVHHAVQDRVGSGARGIDGHGARPSGFRAVRRCRAAARQSEIAPGPEVPECNAGVTAGCGAPPRSPPAGRRAVVRAPGHAKRPNRVRLQRRSHGVKVASPAMR